MKNAICVRVAEGPAGGMIAASIGGLDLVDGVASEIVTAGAAGGNSEQ